MTAPAPRVVPRAPAEERRFRSLVENSLDPKMIVDAEGTILYASPAYARISGLRSEAAVGTGMLERIHPEDRARAESKLKELLAAPDRPQTFEVRWRRANEAWLSLIFTVRDLRGDPAVRGLVVYSRDVTAQRQAEQALREGEARYRQLVELSPNGILVHEEGRIVYCNPTVARLAGVASPEELVGRSVLDFVHADSRAAVIRRLELLAAGGRPTGDGSAVTFVALDGSVREIETVSAPFRIDGRACVHTVLRDVTDRRRAEEALRESEERFRTVIDSLPDGVVLQLADGSIATFNEAAERITGLTALQMLGRAPRPAGWLAVREDGTRFDMREHPSLVALATGYPAACVMGIVETEGAPTRWIAVNTTPLFQYGSRTPYAALSSVVDVNDRVRAAETERVARRAAEEASRAKSEFLANMSHEIRTPMNGVLGMLDLVLDTALDDEQREHLAIAKSSADALLTVINDVLDYSKIEAGHVALEPRPFYLGDTIEETVRVLALRAHRKGLELTASVAPDVPNLVVGDAGRFRQVLVNLVGNAVKFTERGEVAVDVGVEPGLVGDGGDVMLHVAVRDTGIGIPPEKQQLVFEAFVQADSSTTRLYGGTGLGLAISARLVQAMGGRLWVESRVGEGSTFHFTACVGRTNARDMSLAEVVAESDGPGSQREIPVDLRGAAVLVVDDNETNRLILDRMLRSWGVRPILVEHGEAALEAIDDAERRGRGIRLVLLDDQMPGLDGFAVVEALRGRAAWRGAVIMMLGAGDHAAAAARCREVGVAQYLHKPLRQSQLFNALVTALDSAAPRRASRPVTVIAPGARGPYRILVAEDNVVNQRVAVNFLVRRGHAAVVVRNGHEALEALDRERFDLVLMDVQMPAMGGFEATAAIRARGDARAAIPIIAMTAHAMDGDRERCLAAGMDGYVAKPVHPERLFEEIDRVMAAHGAATRPAGTGDPAHAAMENAPLVLDRQVLERNVANDAQLLAELVGLFLDESPRLLAEIRAAAAVEDVARIESAAHTLKSAAGSMAGVAMAASAQVLELVGRRGALTDIPAAIASLEREAARLADALRALAPAREPLGGNSP